MKMKKNLSSWTSPSVVVAVASAIISILAAWFSWNSAHDVRISSAQASAANTYIELRKAFSAAAGAIPTEYRFNDPAPPTYDSNEWRAISEYWFLAFDEWLITKRFGNNTLITLWDERYQGLIYSQLKNKRAHRTVFCSMIREKFSQSCLQLEFGKLYSDLYWERERNLLCDEKIVLPPQCPASLSPAGPFLGHHTAVVR